MTVNHIKILELSFGQFAIQGDLTFASINKKVLKSVAFLTYSRDITLDLIDVSSADSAGLALLIEWIRYTRQHRIQLRFKNIPKQLLSLAKLSSLDKTPYFTNQSL